jgi:hypothetical protein
MNNLALNPTAAVVTGSSPTPSSVSSNANPSASTKDNKGKPNDKQPNILNITTDSTYSLFPPSPTNFAKLEGKYAATVTAVQTVEQPARESTVGRKPGRKARAGKGKPTPKSKVPKPGARVLRLLFTLDQKRADGMIYSVEKDLRPKRNKDSKFGEFLKGILSDVESYDRFFSDYMPVHLLNRRCTLEIKESRRQGQSTFKVLDVLPATAPAPEFTYSGTLGSTVTGRMNSIVEPQAAAA